MTDDAPDAPQDTPPLTRRELRERERAAEAAAASASARPSSSAPITATTADAAPAPAAAAPAADEPSDDLEGIDDLAPSEPVASSFPVAPSFAPAPLASPETADAAAAAGQPAVAAPATPDETPVAAADAGGDETPADAASTTASDAEVASPPKRRGGFWLALLSGIGIGLLALIVGIAAVTVIIPRAAGATPLTVLTGSMRPGLPPGTLVIVKPKPADQIRIGDVVTYEPNANDTKELVTHRVTAITTGTDGSTVFTVKGDANNTPDAPVQSKQVVGVLWYSVPWFGYVNNWIGGSTGFGGLILPIVAVLLLAYAVYAIISGSISSRRKKAAAEAARADRAAPGEQTTPAE